MHEAYNEVMALEWFHDQLLYKLELRFNLLKAMAERVFEGMYRNGLHGSFLGSAWGSAGHVCF